MSTLDPDLASDEGNRTRSHHLKTPGPLMASSSSSSSSFLWSSSQASSCIHCPTNCLRSELQTKRRRKRNCNCEESAIQPLHELTSAFTTKTVAMQTMNPSTIKRTLNDVLDPPINSGNDFLWQKCLEMRCFIPPLSYILRRLRSGRYSHRLSSFQESVAMDRIQRILGVLQNPDTSERFLAILGKIEEMLQRWFPHIKATHSDDDAPVKKKKLHHGASSSSSSPPSLTSSSSFTHLKWSHMSPICSSKTPESVLGGASQVESSFHEVAMQDSVVTSTTDSSHLSLRCGPPPPFCFRSPCLERLLQAKESIIAPSEAVEGGAETP